MWKHLQGYRTKTRTCNMPNITKPSLSFYSRCTYSGMELGPNNTNSIHSLDLPRQTLMQTLMQTQCDHMRASYRSNQAPDKTQTQKPTRPCLEAAQGEFCCVRLASQIGGIVGQQDDLQTMLRSQRVHIWLLLQAWVGGWVGVCVCVCK